MTAYLVCANKSPVGENLMDKPLFFELMSKTKAWLIAKFYKDLTLILGSVLVFLNFSF